MPGPKRPRADDEEEDFPRGGAQVLTAIERRQIQKDAAAEAEQELKAQGSAKKRKQLVGQEGEDEFFTNLKAKGQALKNVELLRFKTLSVGFKLWGMVLEVSPRGLTISLPQGLRGTVTPEEASDVLHTLLAKDSTKAAAALRATLPEGRIPELTELFSVGQYVRATVISISGGEEAGAANGSSHKARKVVGLSLRLKKLLAAAGPDLLQEGQVVPAFVRTVEDHGYTLGFGLKGITGFLRQRDYETYYGVGQRLVPGQLVDVVVARGKQQAGTPARARSSSEPVFVTVDHEAVASSTLKDWPGLTLASLLPGQLVGAKVVGVANDGLLVTFGGFFQGSIDHYNLATVLPDGAWKGRYAPGMKVKARILFVDPAAKKAGLSLLPHLINYRMPAAVPLLGQVFENAVVRRVDRGLGLLLELPMEPEAAAGFAHLSNLVDGDKLPTEDLAAKFKVGQQVAARVIGFRLIDGLTSVSLKPSVIQQSIHSIQDLYPGQLLPATVAKVLDTGLVLQLNATLRAFVPALQMSDLGTKKSKAKFKEGQKVQGKVLLVDPVTKKVQMTLKNSLLGSKLAVLSDLRQAAPGMKLHGVVSGLANWGAYVTFYGGVAGILPKDTLDVLPGQSLEDVVALGQTLRVVVDSVDLTKRKLLLRPSGKKAAAEAAAAAQAPWGGWEVGQVVPEARVVEVLESADFLHQQQQDEEDGGKENQQPVVVLDVAGKDGQPIQAHLPAAHLSDHPGGVEALLKVLAPGAVLGPLLVLQLQRHRPAGAGQEQVEQLLLVTRKQSLVGAAASLPRTISQVKPGAHLPAYISNVQPKAVLVRFLDRVQGRAGLPALADTFVSDASLLFHAGQSVQVAVTSVDEARSRFVVSLKPSVTGAHSGEYLAALMSDLELAAKLQQRADSAADEDATPVDWSTSFRPGSLAAAQVHEVQPIGLLLDLVDNLDVVGHVAEGQGVQGGKSDKGEVFSPGQEVKARVLDVSKTGGIVELSLAAEVVAGAKAKAPKLKLGSEVVAQVLAPKEHYSVVLLPKAEGALGYLSRADFNTQGSFSTGAAAGGEGSGSWQVGTQLQCRVAALPSESNGWRLLLQLVPGGDAAAGGGGALEPGGMKVVNATISRVDDLGLEVIFGKAGSHSGTIHISELQDRLSEPLGSSPLAGYTQQQVVRAAYLGRLRGLGKARCKDVQLSLRPSALAAADQGAKATPVLTVSDLKPGVQLVGWVGQITQEALWVEVGPGIRGRVHRLDVADDLKTLQKYPEGYYLGQPLKVTVLTLDAQQHILDLTLRKASGEVAAGGPQPGQLVTGAVVSTRGEGVMVQLGRGAQGMVALTDIHDAWVPNALAGLTAGQLVKARVLTGAPDSKGRLPLSLRSSQGGVIQGYKQPAATAGSQKPQPAPQEVLSQQELQVGCAVKGYVRAVSTKGLFVSLDRQHLARVKLSQLSDGFVEDPAATFPPGTLVEGKLVAAAAAAGGASDAGVKLEVSLRTAPAGGWRQLEEIKEGELTTGKVRRIEKYGMFIELARSHVSGLAHVSQLPDAAAKKPASSYQVNQVVKVRVMSVDLDSRKVSLSLRPEYLVGDEEKEEEGQEAGGVVIGVKKQAGKAGKGLDLDDQMVDAMEMDGSSSEEMEEEEEEEEEAAAAAAAAAKQLDVDSMELDETSADEDEEDREEEGGSSDLEAGEEDSEEEEAAAAAALAAENGLLRSRDNLLHSGGAGSSWGELQLEGETAAADGDGAAGGEEGAAKLSKGAKKRLKEQREATIRAAEAARLSGSNAPTTAADYERLLLSHPNSSFTWIKFMAFCMSLGEVEKARGVAQRALDTINIREQGEKFNVWVAWLNLENVYGAPTPEEAVMALFQRALQYTDQKRMYLALLDILQRSGRQELVEEVLRTLTKKFSGSCKVWLRAIDHALQTGGDAAGDKCRRLLERALTTLPRRKHIKAISHAALLEFKHGSVERGRSVMEGVLQNYPKRLDLWNIYIDQEVKLGNVDQVRGLLQRATSLSLPPKKMKLLFRRWLEFEQGRGDAAGVEDVKRRAMEYVERTSGAA